MDFFYRKVNFTESSCFTDPFSKLLWISLLRSTQRAGLHPWSSAEEMLPALVRVTSLLPLEVQSAPEIAPIAVKFMWALLVTSEGLACYRSAPTQQTSYGSGPSMLADFHRLTLLFFKVRANLILCPFQAWLMEFESLRLQKINLVCCLLPLFLTPSKIDLVLCVFASKD